MRLREVFRYELEHRVRSASTWVYPFALLLVAFWIHLATADDSSAAALANAPERLAGAAVLPAMFGMLITAALFGDAAVRDVQAGMDPLLYTSSLRKVEYLGGRFLAAFLINAVVLLAIPLAALLVTMAVGSSDPAAVGPFRAAPYLQSYFVFLLPNLVVVGAVLFTIGVLARQVIPVYLGTIGIFIGYVVALNYATGIGAPMLATLVDPLGLVSLQQVTRYWTEAERNARLVGFEPLVLANRAVWLAVAAGVLGILVNRFRFSHADGGGRRARRATPTSVSAVARDEEYPRPHLAVPVAVPRVAGSFGLRTLLRQTFAVARYSIAETASSRWFTVILLGCAGVTLLMGWNVGDTVFETATWPRTLLVAETVQSQRIAPIIYLLIVLFAGELVWKDREVGAAEIADAAPVPNGAALAGRYVALVAIIVMIQLAAMTGGVLIQALQGYYDFELGLYARILLGMQLADYALFAALAMAVHVVVNHKYVGHILVLLTFVATKALPPLGAVEHHLLLYNTDPGWTYSDMNGFGPFAEPFVWFKLYWAAWALLLGVVAVLLWVRGPDLGLRLRLRSARGRAGGSALRVAALAVVLIIGLGGFVFYNTNVLNEYHTRSNAGTAAAEYERRYARFAETPQPTIIAAELRIEIYPESPAVDLWGSYRLVNQTGVPVDSVHVYLSPDMEAHSISLRRAATPVLVDEEVGYRIYRLERPLQPGDSLQLEFDVAFRPRGFPNDDPQTDVVRNGAYFNRSWMPFIGYQRLFELGDDETRSRFGLGRRAGPVAPEEAGGRRRQPFTDADLVHVDATIGTAADQIAVTPGALVRTWVENGRRYFHYATETPVTFGATVFSAEYGVVEDRWTSPVDASQAVSLRIFHHPDHAGNLGTMMSGMKASLDYYTAQFGPYPYGQLRIVETPRYGGFGHAHPETIGFTEDVFFARPKPGEFDQTFYGTAHEVAHTWWGGQVRGAHGVRGQGFLSESLANYSAMMVTEKTHGLEAARQVYDYQMNRYLMMRGRAGNDVPLLQAGDQPYIFYGKGAVAMYLLRDYLGEERVNAALRRYLEKYRAGKPPYPTSLDLYAELQAVTPDSLQYVLTDLFETVTLWAVSTDRAVVEPSGTGEFTVTLEVDANKLRADSAGNETAVEMNDLVEIGVFGPGDAEAGSAGLGEPLYLGRHRIGSGKQTVSVTVPRAPARAGIDPYRKLIDRDGSDNVIEVETETR